MQRNRWWAAVVGTSLVLLVSCGGGGDEPPTGQAIPSSVTSAVGPPTSVCEAFEVNPAFVDDPFLAQIADRADDPAAATSLAVDDPEGALRTREATLATLQEAKAVADDTDPLVDDLDAVIAAYEANIEGLAAVVSGDSTFLPVGADLATVAPAQAVLDHAETECDITAG